MPSRPTTRPDLARARFYAILDTAYVPPERWEEKALALLAGGADLVQLRAKRETPAARRQLLERLRPIFAGGGVPLIINDDWELALAFPGLGLHVGQDDLPAAEARRRLGPDRILGLSTHSLDQAREALRLGPVLSYFAVGPVFPTGTKPDYAAVGLDLVREVAAERAALARAAGPASPPAPFFAIGGIDLSRVEAVRAAGAEGLVAVSAVLLAEDTAAAVRAFRGVAPGYSIRL